MKTIYVFLLVILTLSFSCKKETDANYKVRVEIKADSGEIRTDIQINTEMKSYFNNDKITLFLEDYDSINIYTYYLDPKTDEISQKVYINGDLKKTDKNAGFSQISIKK